MKPNANRDKAVLALKRAIEATFDDDRWRELGYVTNTRRIIEEHPRLLRSLHWGDDDYGGCVLRVLELMVHEDRDNIRRIEEFIGLEAWLKTNDPALYAELYSGAPLPLEAVEAAISVLDIVELNNQLARIKHSIRSDPALAVGSAKELLETVMKLILTAENVAFNGDDIPALLKKVQKALALDPKVVDKTTAEGQVLMRTLNNLGQVVVGVAETRNLVGTGHGRVTGAQVSAIHARLVVNASATLATFLVEVWDASHA